MVVREQRRHAMPGGVCARVPMEQDQGCARSAVTQPEMYLADIAGLEQEPREHREGLGGR